MDPRSSHSAPIPRHNRPVEPDHDLCRWTAPSIRLREFQRQEGARLLHSYVASSQPGTCRYWYMFVKLAKELMKLECCWNEGPVGETGAPPPSRRSAAVLCVLFR